MKKTNFSVIKIIFILAILLLLVLSVFSYKRITTLIDKSDLVIHTNEVKLCLEKISTDVIDAETNQKSFLLTGDSALLKKRDFDFNMLAIELKRIDSLTKDNQNHKENIKLLNIAIDEKLASMKKVMQSYKPLSTSAEFKLNINEAINITTNIKERINKMQIEEDKLMEERAAALNREVIFTPFVLLILILSTILILIAAYNKILRDARLSDVLKSDLEKSNETLRQKNELLLKSENDLKQSNDRMLKIFDNSPVAITVGEIGTNFIVYANKIFYNTFGLTEEEVIGHTSEELKLTTPEEDARLIPIIMSYLDGGRTLEELQKLTAEEAAEVLTTLREKMFEHGFEVNYRRRNGELFWAMVYFEIFGMRDKKYAITSYQDISERKQAEEKIKQALKQLRIAQERALIGTFEMNWRTKEIILSDELYRIYGIEIGSKVEFEEVNKMNIDSKGRLEMVQKAIAEKKPLNYEGRIINFKGELKIMEVSADVVCDEEGIPYKIAGIAQDITERKKAEEKITETAKQLSEAQKIAKIGNWESDLKYNSIKWSDELYHIYGFKPGEIDLSFEEIAKYNHKVDHEYIQKVMSGAIKDKQPFNFDYSIITKNNEVKVLNTIGEVIVDENGEVLKLIGTSQDITERVKTINELHKAEELAKAKQQFLANMSHEIRTPMNSIIGFTHVVLRTDLTKEQQEYVNAIKISGESLLVIINDILDIAKVNAGKMVFELAPFNLCQSVSETILIMDEKIKEKKLELVKDYEPSIPDVIIGDAIRLRQVLLNLLSNAVKFTPQGKITMSIRKLSEDKEKITLEFIVSDTGIGIEEDKLERIFDNFEQASGETSRVYGGTGLGLAIVKKLVELQGGTIFVKSIKGKGSSFGFTLTFEKTDMKMPNQKEKRIGFNGTNKDVKVLVVEDNSFNQLLIKIKLKEFGFDMDIAENGKIAIEKLKENRYDIILMDLQMPEMDGFEATKYIRKEMKSDIPIIALTADVTSTDISKSKDTGMNDYLSKPVDEKMLYDVIIRYVDKG